MLTKLSRSLTAFSFSLSILLLITSFCLIALQIFRNPLGPDSYLHLSVGKYIVNQGYIPTHTEISYKQTQNTIEWMSHGWLSDLTMYLIYGIPSSFIISFILIALLALCQWLIWRIINLYNISHNVGFFVLSITLLILAVYWQFHPFIFIYPLFILSIYITLHSYLRRNHNLLYLIPIISFLWANLYGGYIFIFLLVQLSFLMLTLWARFVSALDKGLSIKFQSFIFALSVATSFINPFGFKVHAFLNSFLYITQVKKAFSSLPGFLRLINQNFILENISTIPYALYLALFLASSLFIMIAFFRFRKEYFQKYYSLIPLTMLFILPFFWIRLIPFSLLGCAPLIASIIYFLLNYRPTKSIFIFVLLQIIFLVYTCFLLFFPYKTIDVPIPIEQLRIIKSLALPLNYLITPEYIGYGKFELNEKLNIDLYDDVFDKSETLNILIYSDRIPRDALSQTINRQNASTILTTKEAGNMAQTLNSEMKDEWTLIYFDTNGFLFVRNDTVEKSFLKEHGIQYIDIGTNLGVKKENINLSIKELERFLKKYPNNILARGQLATLYRITQKSTKAEKLLDEIPLNKWNYTLFTEMGRILASKGDCKSAEAYFLRALDDRTEQNYSRAILDLAVIYGGCLNDKTKAKHYFERYLSFPLPDSEKQLAKRLAIDFGIILQ